MKNFDLATKIKDLRTAKAMSQDELASKSGITLRTVQRVENGETEPRGDTLKRIAVALDVFPEDLVGIAEKNDPKYVAFFNLSALSLFAFPLLGIIVPMAIWMIKRGKISGLDNAGKKLLNFQISWCILLFIIYGYLLTSELLNFNLLPRLSSIGRPELIILIIVFLYLVNTILIIVNTVRSFNAKSVFYQPAIRFFKIVLHA